MSDEGSPTSVLWRTLDSCVKSVTGVRGGRALAAIFVAAIVAATLFPTDAIGGERFLICVVCGDRGMADAILNTIMFVPLGLALALGGAAASVAIPLCFILSATIESIQFFVPGRDSSLGDLVFNTVGGAIGAVVVWRAASWLSPRDRVAPRLAAVAVVMFAGVIALTGWLFTPTHPDAPYVVQWEPDRYHLRPHPGEIADVRLGTWSLPPESMWSWQRFRDAWNRGDTLVVHMRGAVTPPFLAPILSVHDLKRREVMFVGDDRGELVVRPRLRALDARFDQPDLRQRARGRDPAQDSLTIMIARQADGFLLRLDGEATTRYNTAGRGWALLYYVESAPGWGRAAIGVLWLAALCVPAGFWARTRRATALVVVAVVTALATIPAVSALGPTPLAEYVAAVAGVLLGRGLAQVAMRLRSPVPLRDQAEISRVYTRA